MQFCSFVIIVCNVHNLHLKHNILQRTEVLFTMDVYFNSETQHTTVKYNQQLSEHGTIPCRAIGLLAR
jgi:hypothetical protein